MDARKLAASFRDRIGDLGGAAAWRGYRPDDLRSVPSWGLSLMLHALLLFLLALVISAGRREEAPAVRIEGGLTPPGLGDITSLVPADRSGDPFTAEQSDETPSLGLEPIDPLMKLAGRPELPSLARYAPELSSPAALPKPGIGKGQASVRLLPGIVGDLSAPFAGRLGMERAKLVRREGGTAKSEKAVEDGLDWIARHQRADGSWSLNFQEQCEGDGCPPHRALASDTAATGLALLPLLGAGYIHTVKCRHQDAVRRGLEWLTSRQQENGDLYTGGSPIAHLYSHAIAAMAIGEAFGLSRDPALQEHAHRALAFIVEAQNADGGGWRYRPGQAGDTSVFGWQIFALRSAHLAGLKVPGPTLRGCSIYLDMASADPKRITYSYQPGQALSPVMTAEALVGRQILGWPRDHPSLVKGAGRIAAHLERSTDRNIYYWYYATQLLHNMKNREWDRWNLKIREGLIATQVRDETCARGSWSPDYPEEDRWGMAAGRLFQTSLSVLTLEVYYRYLPLYRTADDDPLSAVHEPVGPAEAARVPDADGGR